MKTLILEAFEDDMTGMVGLGIKGVPRDETTNAAHDGLVIAHDIIEHVNGFSKIGTIDDELEALGAIWYVRGQFGQLTRDGSGSYHTVHENIASDVTRMLYDYAMGQAEVSSYVPRTHAVSQDLELQEILLCADKGKYDNCSDAQDRANIDEVYDKYRSIALNRMRIGYSKARRRWHRRGNYAANAQFWAIANAVNPHAKRSEIIGSQFKLTYGNGKAYCHEYYPEDDY